MKFKQKVETSATYSINRKLSAPFKRGSFSFFLAGIALASSSDELATAETQAYNFITSRDQSYTGTERLSMGRDVLEAVANREEELKEIGLEQLRATSASLEDAKEQLAPQPPRTLEGLLCLFTPRKNQNELKGQLTEAYTEWTEEYGERWAKVLYAKEIVVSLGPVFGRTAEWSAKYKVMHYLGEIIGRFSQH